MTFISQALFPAVVRPAVVAGAALLLAGAVSAPSRAESPSFDCRKASKQIELLICKNADLAQLDRTMASVYRGAQAAAVANAGDDGNGALSRLETIQAEWLKDRNRCARNADPAACTARIYQIQSAFLQAKYRLVPGAGPVFYDCDGASQSTILATFLPTTPPTARFERNGVHYAAIQKKAVSGLFYVGELGLQFWDSGDTAQVIVPNPQGGQEVLACRKR